MELAWSLYHACHELHMYTVYFLIDQKAWHSRQHHRTLLMSFVYRVINLRSNNLNIHSPSFGSPHECFVFFCVVIWLWMSVANVTGSKTKNAKCENYDDRIIFQTGSCFKGIIVRICFQHAVNWTSDACIGRVHRVCLRRVRSARVARVVPVLPLLSRRHQRRDAICLQAAFPGDDLHEHCT